MNHENRSFFSFGFPTFRAVWRAIATGDGRRRLMAASRQAAVAAWSGRPGRFTRFTAKAVLALAVVGIVVHSVLLVVWGRQLERKLEEIKARGEPVTAADLTPAPVPDSENAAVVYEQIFSVMEKYRDSRKRSRNLRYAEYINPATTPAQREAVAPALREDLQQVAQVFPLVNEATNRPECVFTVDWEEGTSASFPHLSKLRELSRLLAVKSVVEAEDGNMDAAVEYLMLGLRISDALSNEPTLIACTIKSSCINMTANALVTISQNRSLTLQQARRVYDATKTISLDSSYLQAMRGERALNNWLHELSRTDPVFWMQYSRSTSEPGRFRTTCYSVASYLIRPFAYRDHRVALELWDIQLRLIQLPRREALKRINERKALDWQKVPRLFPIFTASTVTRDATKAQIGLAQTAMALKAYQSLTGSYPASLDELKTRIDWPIPDDPFSGKPFVYKRSGQGFLLYSWGWNLKDDGGKTTSEAILAGDINGSDLVWKCER